MDRHQRLGSLLELVVQRGHVRIEDITRELEISPATARRDLDALAQQQLITRTRGGAAVAPGSADLPLRYRAARQGDQKERIARAAAELVVAGQVVGLNGGTTTTEVAREIAVQPGLQGGGTNPLVIVTNAVNIANELAVRSHLRVVVTGGVVRPHSYELTGPLAGLLLGQVSLDLLFLGVDAFDPEGGASATDEGEASTNAALAERADRVLVVADSTKLGRSAFARILPTTAVHTLITDTDADPGLVAAFEAAGIAVILC
ncbi:DeoR/GlpR family DNA-binding transcription regulator [Occultella gossypii]|uniref:DeoR/GlpR transcriptional regulator n=1 Tax=Occultella gossypii TaxID=2800820 RepID=A0ABS7S5M1_9MICO|nr:DeoR/GlpR family DNA-binding transcription regulator [Occultella gossypii]MBZ2195070.1 DeoR/GlpR transcriptional regulator [Occultella gossypii]